MRNLLFLIVSVMVCSCSPKVYEGMKWQSNPVDIDGQQQDWSVPLKYFDKSAQLSYEIANDQQNVYLAFMTTDKTTARQIMMSGITLWIDTVARSKAYPFSLKFPVHERPDFSKMRHGSQAMRQGNPDDMEMSGPPSDFNPEHMERDNHRGPMGTNGMFGPMNLKMQLFGFPSLPDSTIVNLPDGTGINAKTYQDSTGFVFVEMVLPFSTFYKPEISKSDTSNVFSFKITLENASFPMGGPQGGGNQMQGGDHGGMGTPPGGGFGGFGGGPGGMGGGGMMPPSGNMSDDTEDEKLEILINLHLSFE